ncbi:MAG: hypothetical protein J6J45_07580 [Clostridia bacterium]|nr:hypothetical protein [Clostridia bacterium]
MKKTKAQPSVTKADEKNTNGKNIRNSVETAPSDIRVKDSGESVPEFKKVLYGYDADEVNAYIDEMNKTHAAAVRNYESRLSSVKEELLLSNRERDSLIAKHKKFQSKTAESLIAAGAENADGKSEELKEALVALQEKLEQTEAEKELLEKHNRELKAASEEHSDAAKKYAEIADKFKAVLSEKELLAVENSEKEKQIQVILQELEQKNEKISALSLEAEESKRASTDFEIKNGVLEKQLEEKETENSSLKEQNRAQAYDFADRLNKLESEQAQSRLAAQKDMQMREYYINRAELTLAELTKQMEQIKQSFGGSQDA